MPDKSRIRARFLLVLFACFASFGALACEKIDRIPVDTGPTLQNGVYCLAADVSLDWFESIRLRSNTTLDCQGHRIKDASGNASYAILSQGYDNVVVQNCVFDGFSKSIYLSDVTNFRLRNNVSINARSEGLSVFRSQGSLRDNVIHSPATAYTWSAIMILDGLVDVVGNTVILGDYTPVVALVPRNGIYLGGQSSGVISDNLITADADADEAGAGVVSSSPDFVIYRNQVVATPGSQRTGIVCGTSTSVQNSVHGFATPYSGCSP